MEKKTLSSVELANKVAVVMGTRPGIIKMAPVYHALKAAGLDAVIHIGRSSNGRRRVQEVCVLRPGDDHIVRSVPALQFTEQGVESGPGLPWLRRRLDAAA